MRIDVINSMSNKNKDLFWDSSASLFVFMFLCLLSASARIIFGCSQAHQTKLLLDHLELGACPTLSTTPYHSKALWISFRLCVQEKRLRQSPTKTAAFPHASSQVRNFSASALTAITTTPLNRRLSFGFLWARKAWLLKSKKGRLKVWMALGELNFGCGGTPFGWGELKKRMAHFFLAASQLAFLFRCPWAMHLDRAYPS